MEREMYAELSRRMSYLDRTRRQALNSSLSDSGLVGPMFMLLLSIDRNPGSSQDFLADRFYADKGSIARAAKKLETLGYIRRETSSEDRRQYRLFVTEAGLGMCAEIRRVLGDWALSISGSLSESELATVVELLGRMVRGHEEGERL